MGCGASSRVHPPGHLEDPDLPPIPEEFANEMRSTIANTVGLHRSRSRREEEGTGKGKRFSPDAAKHGSSSDDPTSNSPDQEDDVAAYNKRRLLQYYVRYVDGKERDEDTGRNTSKVRRMTDGDERTASDAAAIATASGTYRAARSSRHYSDPPSALDSGI